MNNYEETVKLGTEIINEIRKQDDWEATHRVIKFGDKTVGYYDTSAKNEFFTLKDDNYEITFSSEYLDVKYFNQKCPDEFSILEWLKELHKIVIPEKKVEPDVMIINGIEYVRKNPQ